MKEFPLFKGTNPPTTLRSLISRMEVKPGEHANTRTSYACIDEHYSLAQMLRIYAKESGAYDMGGNPKAGPIEGIMYDVFS